MREDEIGALCKAWSLCDALTEWAETLTPEKLVVFKVNSGCDDILIARPDRMRASILARQGSGLIGRT